MFNIYSIQKKIIHRIVHTLSSALLSSMNSRKLSQTLCRTLTIVSIGGVTIQDDRNIFSTRKKLLTAGILLLLLAVVDSFFTDFGIQKQYITEANPLMALIYDTSIWGFYALKISLPCVLLYLLTEIEQKRYLKLLVGSAILLYSVVLFQHIYWISLVL
ncbi:DUF5658 family protein [Sporosarcina psychrophila]|uniref:DUF5658 family protein n=1 Tax=Sporosarcina psychrophila TaxID=1476 RepID=UPI000B0A5F8A|nr:DUF5658 family protein [Sporosarcina psychrophila]